MRRHTPGAKAPSSILRLERPKAEALGYLEANATATANATANTTAGWAGAVRALARMAHLSDDKAVAKMGHPDLWLDVFRGVGR